MSNANDVDAKIIKILRSSDFQVTGYYPYGHAVDLMVLFRLPQPFTNPIRVIIEIAKGSITKESIESFVKMGKNMLAEKFALFCIEEDFDNLEENVKSTMSTLNVDYIGGEELRNVLSSITMTQEEVKDCQDTLYRVSPKRLVDALPELSGRRVPNDIRNSIPERKAWEIMEDAVFAAFQFCFAYETRKLGYEKRFKTEPEGLVVTPNRPPFALLYDCKSTEKIYKMSIDDERAVISYINDKSEMTAAYYSCDLRYFVIVAPDFGGDLDLRKRNVHMETNASLVFMKAEALKSISLWAYEIPHRFKKLIDLRQLFNYGEKIIDEQIVETYKGEFDSKHKQSY